MTPLSHPPSPTLLFPKGGKERVVNTCPEFPRSDTSLFMTTAHAVSRPFCPQTDSHLSGPFPPPGTLLGRYSTLHPWSTRLRGTPVGGLGKEGTTV